MFTYWKGRETGTWRVRHLSSTCTLSKCQQQLDLMIWKSGMGIPDHLQGWLAFRSLNYHPLFPRVCISWKQKLGAALGLKPKHSGMKCGHPKDVLIAVMHTDPPKQNLFFKNHLFHRKNVFLFLVFLVCLFMYFS